MFFARPVLGATLFFYLFPCLVFGDIVNRTIDDTFGDSSTGRLPTYFPTSPSSPWANASCGGCAIQPDINQAFNKTFTAATWHPADGTMSITMQFNGTTIYVFFILANNEGEGITTLTLANFTLDDDTPQIFEHVPDSQSTDILYNQLVFNQTNLTNTQHTLVIFASNPTQAVYVNFDYAIYTHEDEIVTNSASSLSLTTPLAKPSISSTSAQKLVEVTTSSKSTAPPPITTLATFPVTSSMSSSSSSSSISTTSSIPLESETTQPASTSASKKSIATGPVAGAIIGIMIFSVLVVLGILWIQRRHKRRSLEIPTQFPIMKEQPDGTPATPSTVLSNDAATHMGSRKLEAQRVQRLALDQLPAFVEEDIRSITSETNQATHGHRLSQGVYRHGSVGSSLREDVEYKELATGEVDLRLQRRSLYSETQQQAASTEELLEHIPPPKYQPSSHP